MTTSLTYQIILASQKNLHLSVSSTEMVHHHHHLQSGNLVIILLILLLPWWLKCSEGLVHRVGGRRHSVWSIPLTRDFYTNWSSSQSFHVGDTLVFEFESEFHDVVQVSRREYESCTAENPFQTFLVGPANITLFRKGVFYFICSFANYCDLGQKISVTVDRHRSSLRHPPPPLDEKCCRVTPPPPAHVSSSMGHPSSPPQPQVVVEPASDSISLVNTRRSGWVLITCMMLYVIEFGS